jgi:hypothetical protein
VEPGQHAVPPGHLPLDDGDVVPVVLVVGESQYPEAAVEGREIRDPDEAYAEALGAVLAVPVEAAGPVLPDAVVQYLELGVV